jgi:aminopeptidase N
MLEYVLGHDAWKRALTHYLHQHAYSNVETNDLQQAIKDKLGLNLDWFFDEWIYRGGEPNYEVSYEEISAGSKEAATLIRIRQTHTTSETVHTFKMPVKLEVHYADQSCDSVMQTISEASEEIRIPNSAGKKIDFVLFDPCSNILKQLSFKKSFEELGNQASKAANMLDRYDALVALRETDLAKKRELLLHVLKHETHYGIINEIVNQLINDSNATTKSAMQDLMKNRYAAVRNNVLQGLSHIDESWKPRYVSALEDSSYEVVKTALDKLCTQFPGEAKTHLEKVKGVAGMNHAVTLKRLEFAINLGIDRDASTAELVKYASTAYEFRTRNNAFATLKSVNYLDKEVVKNLFQAVCSWNARLAGPAAELCNYYSAQAPYRNMMQDSFSHENLTQKQREALQKQISWLK